MNAKYGRLSGGQVVYAPSTLETESGMLINPSEASYLAAGWKRVVEEPPAPEEGCVVDVSGWEETETEIVRTYKQVPSPVPPEPEPEPEPEPTPGPVGPRRFSKFKLVVALKAAGHWILTKAWIEERGLYDLYLAAQEFVEDNEWFAQGRAEIQALARLTDEQVEAILAQCVIA